jgi:hypothetical protein
MSQQISQPSDEGEDGKPPRPKNRSGGKLRKLGWIGLVLLILLGILIYCIPSILSTGAVRGMILDRINSSALNGKLLVKDWKLTWTSGVQIDDVELHDASDAHVVSIGLISTNLNLLKAAMGNYDLGDVQITGVDFNLRRDKNGQLNLAGIFKPTPPSNQPSSKLPNVKGTIHLSQIGGTFEDDSGPQTVLFALDMDDSSIAIKDINQPIEESIAFTGTLNHQTAVNVKVNGTIAAVQNGQIDLTQLGGSQNVQISAVDSASGDAKAIDLQAVAQVQLGGPLGATIPSFEITHGSFNLHRLQDEGMVTLVAGPWIAKHPLTLDSGTITLAGKGSADASGITLNQPLTVHIEPADISLHDDMGGTQTAHIPVTDLAISGNSGNLAANLQMGSADNSLLAMNAGVQTSGQTIALNLSKCQGDLAKLQAALGPILPVLASSPAIQMISQNAVVANSGQFSATVAATYDGKTLAITTPLNASVTNLTVLQNGNPTPISAMSLTATAAGTVSQTEDGGLDLKLPTLSVVEANDLQIQSDPATPLHYQMTKAGVISGTGTVKLIQANLPRLASMAAVGMPADRAAALKKLTGGSATGAFGLQQAADGSCIASADLTISQPQYGQTQYNGFLRFRIGTTLDAAGKSVSNSNLDLDSTYASILVSNPQPIVLADLSDPNQVALKSQITVDGDIAQICRLAESLGGLQPNAYPYQGHFHQDETIQKNAGDSTITLVSDGGIGQFKVLGTSQQPVFAEDSVAIHQACSFDIKSRTIAIAAADPMTLTLKSSGALALAISGTASDLSASRKLDGVTIALDYDLAKIWPIVQPMLPPDKQQKLADLVIAGKQKRTFLVSGTYPAGLPFNQAIKTLTASGAFAVDSLSTQGITLTKFEEPVSLKNGILRTVYADQPEGKNAPKPAACNGGTVDLGVISVDLTHDPMLLSMPNATAKTPQQVCKNVQLNQTMANSLLGSDMANPLFGQGTTVNQGFFDLSVPNCQNVPLSSLVQQQTPDNTGTLSANYNIRQLQLSGGILGILGVAGNQPANINNASIQLAGGKVTQDTVLQLNKTQSLHVFGVVGLQTMQFMPMTIGIPPSLLSKQWVPNQGLLAYLPNEIEVPMEGSVSNPQIRLDQVMPKLVEGATQKMLLGNLTGQAPPNNPNGQNNNGQNNGQQGSSTSQQQPPLDNLLQGLLQPQPKKKKQ